jgi:hypothetical protein
MSWEIENGELRIENGREAAILNSQFSILNSVGPLIRRFAKELL